MQLCGRLLLIKEVVIIDDFDKYHVQLGYAKKIIVTSNYHPQDIWDDPRTSRPHYAARNGGTLRREAPAIHPAYNVVES